MEAAEEAEVEAAEEVVAAAAAEEVEAAAVEAAAEEEAEVEAEAAAVAAAVAEAGRRRRRRRWRRWISPESRCDHRRRPRVRRSAPEPVHGRDHDADPVTDVTSAEVVLRAVPARNAAACAATRGARLPDVAERRRPVRPAAVRRREHRSLNGLPTDLRHRADVRRTLRARKRAARENRATEGAENEGRAAEVSGSPHGVGGESASYGGGSCLVVAADPVSVGAVRGAVEVRDQGQAVAPRVPRPGLVVDAVRVGPVDHRRRVRRRAAGGVIALAELAEDDRHLRGDRGRVLVQAGRCVAGVPAVHVLLGHQLVQRIRRLVRQPLLQVVRPVDPRRRDHVRRRRWPGSRSAPPCIPNAA